MFVSLVRIFHLCLLITLGSFSLRAQPTWTFDPFGKEKKPAEYQEKLLPSERTGDKKFTRFRRFTHNNTTHYNYFFNAKTKMNLVLDMARSQQQDDLSKLLPFYPYSLDQTAAQQIELDSVIYKSTAGILLHDLRSDWVDNLYLLIGKSYFYRKVFDSAILTFQFINYNLFPREKGEDDNRIVGTNQQNGVNKLSIADPEKRNLYKKIFSLPPSRNDALIWLAKTYLEDNQYGESAGLLNILQEDPNLPKRLVPQLHEITAYWYFKQAAYDSAAVHLEKALPAAPTSFDRSRWQFLLAQLYELTGQFDKASAYYIASARKTVDPLIEIYARLNNAKMLRNSGNIRELNYNIERLVKMARKDKYENYRDIIYHSAGQLSMKKPDTLVASAFFEKSISVNKDNLKFRNQAHLALGRIAYHQKAYKKAADHYDSLDISEPSLLTDSAEVVDRKASLRKVADQLSIIQMEDSLQMIASMPLDEQEKFVRKLIRKMRKDKSIPDTDSDAGLTSGGTLLNSFGATGSNEPADLFSSSTKGDWYFYNNGAKSRGFSEFKSRWGKRENVDNWRRQAAVSAAIMQTATDPLAPSDPNIANSSDSSQLYNYETMMSNLPVTTEKMDSSNMRLSAALLELARLFQYELIDYHQAVQTYELYLQRFPEKLEDGQVYLGLHYCNKKIGDAERAAYYLKLLEKTFPGSQALKSITDPLSLQPEKNNPIVSAEYDRIYQLFMQENFDEAMEAKRDADTKHGDQYWTPQLMYMEAICLIKCATDSEAILALSGLITRFPESPLGKKASALLDVLNRKNEIVSYLNNLTITRLQNEERILISDNAKIVRPNMRDVAPALPKRGLVGGEKRTVNDTLRNRISVDSSRGYAWQSGKQHFVVMVLDQVDPVFINETKNAMKRFSQTNGHAGIQITKDTLDAKRNLLLFGLFENADDALVYHDLIKRNAGNMLSWLTASKYRFIVIHADNLKLIQQRKDLDKYIEMLRAEFPERFK